MRLKLNIAIIDNFKLDFIYVREMCRRDYAREAALLLSRFPSSVSPASPSRVLPADHQTAQVL